MSFSDIYIYLNVCLIILTETIKLFPFILFLDQITYLTTVKVTKKKYNNLSRNLGVW